MQALGLPRSAAPIRSMWVMTRTEAHARRAWEDDNHIQDPWLLAQRRSGATIRGRTSMDPDSIFQAAWIIGNPPYSCRRRWCRGASAALRCARTVALVRPHARGGSARSRSVPGHTGSGGTGTRGGENIRVSMNARSSDPAMGRTGGLRTAVWSGAPSCCQVDSGRAVTRARGGRRRRPRDRARGGHRPRRDPSGTAPCGSCRGRPDRGAARA